MEECEYEPEGNFVETGSKLETKHDGSEPLKLTEVTREIVETPEPSEHYVLKHNKSFEDFNPKSERKLLDRSFRDQGQLLIIGNQYEQNDGIPYNFTSTRHKNVQNFQYEDLLSGLAPFGDLPPSYDEIISDAKAVKKDTGVHFDIKESDMSILQFSSMKRDFSDRFDSIEETVTESRQMMTQTHHAMNERLERMEQILQENQPQIELNEDRVSQRVVELLMSNDQFGAMMQSVEVSTECRTTQVPITKVPLWMASCPKPCLCVCHVQNQFSNRENGRDVAMNNKRSRKSTADKTKKKEVNEHTNKVDDEQLMAGACGGDPEDPSDGDSSSDDDDNNGRWNKNKKIGMKDKRRRNEIWEIDEEAWLTCVNGGHFEQQALSLLKQKKLPNQGALNAVWLKCETSSSILKDICNNICFYIKNKSELILDVWAATIHPKEANLSCNNNIVFVVLTKDTGIICEENFETYQKCILQVNESSFDKEISRKELEDPLNPEEKETLENCLRENGKLLMDSHSNLTRVTASWYRAYDNDTETPLLQREVCIVLYVPIKGYIPVGEKHFPPEIGGFPVVVREGVFTLCRGANEYHQNAKMGCAIRGERHGTLGAFIEFENDRNLYGITCAHVLFGDNKLKEILEEGTIVFNGSTGSETVYQPASEVENKPLGTTEMVFYRSGGNGLTGMEIALININQDRWPTEGTFPDDSDYSSAGFGHEKPFVFCSGRVFDPTKSDVSSPVVYKYGCESKLTRGMCRVNGASVRTMKFKDNILESELVLHGQMEIQQLDSSPFAENGDSGALAFIDDASYGLSALGIFEGRMNGIYMITPINDVLNELCRLRNNRCRLKIFSPLDQRINDTRVDLWATVSSLSVNVGHVQNKLNTIEQDLAQDLAQHKKEITYELKKQHDEHVKSSLEIKYQQEMQKEELKSQSEELKRQGEEYKKQSEDMKEIKDQTAQILAILKQPRS